MALATQCPHCHTAFKVAYDQLKLRAGLVRCGTCKQVFNGIENLVRPDALTSGLSPVAPGAAAAPAPELPKPATATEKSADLPPLDLTTLEETPSTDFAPIPAPILATPSAPMPAPVASTKGADPLQYTSLADFTLPQDSEPAPPVVVPEAPPAAPLPDQPIAGLPPISSNTAPLPEALAETEPAPVPPPQAPPATEPEPSAPPVQKQAPSAPALPPRDETPPEEETLPEAGTDDFSLAEDETDTPADKAEAAEHDDIPEPGFVLRSRRRQRIGRILRFVMGIGSVLLLAGAVLQGAYSFRNQLAAWFPQTKPALAQLCQVAGCQVKLPAQIDMVTIESNELQALAADKNTFLLTLLLRNHSAVAQAWPAIELTLNDADETALARRVLQPRDYLPPSQDVARGFAANSEQALKLSFELAQLKASGYRVYLFYP